MICSPRWRERLVATSALPISADRFLCLVDTPGAKAQGPYSSKFSRKTNRFLFSHFTRLVASDGQWLKLGGLAHMMGEQISIKLIQTLKPADPLSQTYGTSGTERGC